MKKKIILPVKDILILEEELNGNKAKGITGLLKEKLPVFVKFWLNSLAKQIADDVNAVTTFQNDFIKANGVEKDNSFYIPQFIDSKTADGKEEKIVNEKYTQFVEEMNKLSAQEKEISYEPFKLTWFEKLETSDSYDIFFRLIDNDTIPST